MLELSIYDKNRYIVRAQIFVFSIKILSLDTKYLTKMMVDVK